MGQLVPERMVLREAWRFESDALRSLVEVAELVQRLTKAHHDIFLLGAAFPAARSANLPRLIVQQNITLSFRTR